MSRLDTRQRVGLVVATAIVVTVTVLVSQFGVIPFPDVAKLADEPDPRLPGRLAYVRTDGDGPCVHVVDGSGHDDEVACYPGTGIERFGWTDEGYLALVVWDGGARHVETVDPVTGGVVDTTTAPVDDDPRPDEPWQPDRVPFGSAMTRPDGTTASARSPGGRVAVTVQRPGEPPEVVWEASGPRSFSLSTLSWSPDGEWIVVRDSLGRLLVLGADGDPEPRVWVEDVGWEYRWYIRGHGDAPR